MDPYLNGAGQGVDGLSDLLVEVGHCAFFFCRLNDGCVGFIVRGIFVDVDVGLGQEILSNTYWERVDVMASQSQCCQLPPLAATNLATTISHIHRA